MVIRTLLVGILLAGVATARRVAKGTFKLENAKMIDLPLARLSEESQTAIVECR